VDSCSLPPCGAPAKDLWGTRPSEESKPQRAQNVAHCGRTLHVTVSAEKPGKEVKPKCHPRVAELRPQQGGGHPFGASNRAWWRRGRKASQESGEASEAQMFSTSTQSKGPPVTTKCHRRTSIPSLNMFEHVVATTNHNSCFAKPPIQYHQIPTSSTAQRSGGSFKDRKPIG